MKKSMIYAMSLLCLAVSTQSTLAASQTGKVSRTERIQLQQGIKTYEVNPFTDTKRQMRSDRIRVSKVNTPRAEYIKIKRSDRIAFYQAI